MADENETPQVDAPAEAAPSRRLRLPKRLRPSCSGRAAPAAPEAREGRGPRGGRGRGGGGWP